METIKEMIEQQNLIRGRMGFNLMDRFLLRNGQEFKRIDHTLPMGIIKECFKNAAEFVINADLDEGYRYCEGYAYRPGLPMLIHHAWVLDNHDRTLDLTWRDNGECLYWGVPFSLDTLIMEMAENGAYGLLDIGITNVRLMQEIDNTTVAYLDEMANARRRWKMMAEKIESE